MENLKVTTLDELKEIAVGEVVSLPGYGEKPFNVRLKRPSLLSLASSGRIPNSLLSTATELFTKGNAEASKSNDNALGDMYKLCKVMAEAALVEPSYKELEEIGYELTDEQLLAIFNYTQQGIKSLRSFR